MTTTNNRLTAEELNKLRQTDFGKKPGFETAETMLTREVGKITHQDVRERRHPVAVSGSGV